MRLSIRFDAPSRRRSPVAAILIVGALLLTVVAVHAPTADAKSDPGYCARISELRPDHRAEWSLISERLNDSDSGSAEIPAAEGLVVQESLDGGSTLLETALSAVVRPMTATSGASSLQAVLTMSVVTEATAVPGDPAFTDTATLRYGFAVDVDGAGAELNLDLAIAHIAGEDTGDVADGVNIVEVVVTETMDDGVTPLPNGFTTTLISDDAETDIVDSVALLPGVYSVQVTGTGSIVGTADPSTGGSGKNGILVESVSRWNIDCADAAPSCAAISSAAPIHDLEWALVNELSGVSEFDTKSWPATERSWHVRNKSAQRVAHWGTIDQATASNGGETVEGSFRLALTAKARPEVSDGPFTNGARGTYGFNVDVTDDNAALDIYFPFNFRTRVEGDVPEGSHRVWVNLSNEDGLQGSYVVTRSQPSLSFDLVPGSYTIDVSVLSVVKSATAVDGYGLAQTWGVGEWSIDCAAPASKD